MRALWDEFEARETAEARFARALDRLHPLLHNYYTQGRAWREHGVTVDQVLAVNQPLLADGAPALEEYATRLDSGGGGEGVSRGRRSEGATRAWSRGRRPGR